MNSSCANARTGLNRATDHCGHNLERSTLLYHTGIIRLGQRVTQMLRSGPPSTQKTRPAPWLGHRGWLFSQGLQPTDHLCDLRLRTEIHYPASRFSRRWPSGLAPQRRLGLAWVFVEVEIMNSSTLLTSRPSLGIAVVPIMACRSRAPGCSRHSSCREGNLYTKRSGELVRLSSIEVLGR